MKCNIRESNLYEEPPFFVLWLWTIPCPSLCTDPQNVTLEPISGRKGDYCCPRLAPIARGAGLPMWAWVSAWWADFQAQWQVQQVDLVRLMMGNSAYSVI